MYPNNSFLPFVLLGIGRASLPLLWKTNLTFVGRSNLLQMDVKPTTLVVGYKS